MKKLIAMMKKKRKRRQTANNHFKDSPSKTDGYALGICQVCRIDCASACRN